MKCYEIVDSDCFRRQKKHVLKKYPKASDDIEQKLKSLERDPRQGDVPPGYGADLEVRKLRIGLPAYKIGKSGGLRLVFLVLVANGKVYPVSLYAKPEYRSEADEVAFVKKSLKTLMAEIL